MHTVVINDRCTIELIEDDKTRHRHLPLLLDHFLTPNKEGDNFMSTHEFDAYFDMQDIIEPDYHEQIAVMHEFEMTRETALKQQGAIDALHNLTVTLSVLCLRDDVQGAYYFGMHEALEVVKSNLDVVRGGVL